MAKGEQNMLGQRLYKLKRGFWPWALIQNFSRSLQTLSSLTLYGWSLSLTCQRGGKIHGTNEIRGRQDSLINITHPEVMPFTSQC